MVTPEEWLLALWRMLRELHAAFVVGSVVWPVQCIRTHLLLAVPATSRHLLCKKKKWERNGLLLLFNKRSKWRSFSFSTLMLETPFSYGDRFRDLHNEACVYLEFNIYFFQKERAREARTVVISEIRKCCRAATQLAGKMVLIALKGSLSFIWG